MMRIPAKLENINKILEQIKADIKNRILKAGQRTTEQTTQLSWELMKEHAPVASGSLRSSIGKRVIYGYPIMFGVSMTGLSPRRSSGGEVSTGYAQAVEYGVPAGAYGYEQHGRNYSGVPPWGEGSRLYEWVRLRGLSPALAVSAKIARKIGRRGITAKHFIKKSHSVLVGKLPDVVRRIFDKHLHF